MPDCFPTSQQGRTRYEFPESIFSDWRVRAGGSGADPPRPPRAFRNRSVQLPDVPSEDSEADDPSADAEEPAPDGVASAPDCSARSSLRASLFCTGYEFAHSCAGAGPRLRDNAG